MNDVSIRNEYHNHNTDSSPSLDKLKALCNLPQLLTHPRFLPFLVRRYHRKRHKGISPRTPRHDRNGTQLFCLLASIDGIFELIHRQQRRIVPASQFFHRRYERRRSRSRCQHRLRCRYGIAVSQRCQPKVSDAVVHDDGNVGVSVGESLTIETSRRSVGGIGQHGLGLRRRCHGIIERLGLSLRLRQCQSRIGHPILGYQKGAFAATAGHARQVRPPYRHAFVLPPGIEGIQSGRFHRFFRKGREEIARDSEEVGGEGDGGGGC
mmetsp:Transcript_17994/g.31009  ORF Transcript_17994/g.31009 Transcript_17994/m.31009 type:complete len:265 (-) Transcript_17994:375-1169(-)